MSWEGRINGDREFLHDKQVSAGQQRDNGIRHLASLDTDFVSIIDHVCVHDYAAESWAITRQLHPRKGIDKLRESLDRLCKYYGIT
jgi:hypothetical protein